ncbi:hypothetical protein LNV09_04825 [Paucibacter sp. B2R-40]|uniref:hypothetical protein n=1 Tax=Paucibacter sp. B2R-40 TaxID=2893554 RepID=UPI0021E48B5B|nr:hypothetical protein [Paucibacter sp. B2R-40]MCV2353480.1 hypothetical protein [Paucibacter sp. B2R-40]
MRSLRALRSNYSPLLLAPFQQRRHTGELWVWLALLLLTLALALACAIMVDLTTARLVLGIAAATSLLILWGISFASLRRQNHPTAARLVPGHLARLRCCAVGLLLVLSATSAVLFGSQLGQPLAWGLGAAVVMLSVAAMLRWYRLWFLIWIVPSLGFWWPVNALWLRVWHGVLHWYGAQPASLALVAGLLLPWLLSRLLQDGGAAHQASYREAEMLRLAFADQTRGLSTGMYFGKTGLTLTRLFSWPRPLWERYLLAHAKPAARSVLARAELACWGNQHWTSILGSLTVILALLAIGAVAIAQFYAPNWSEFGGNGSVGLQIGIVSMVLNPLLGLAASLHRSRREQALLMLLPAMPRGQTLNRLLARRLLTQYFLQWSLALALICLMMAMASGGGAPRLGLYALLLALPMGSYLLRDWSRQAAPVGAHQVLPLIAMAAGAAVLAGMAWLGLSLWITAALSLILTLVLLRRRWQRWVLLSPAALPVGRWA